MGLTPCPPAAACTRSVRFSVFVTAFVPPVTFRTFPVAVTVQTSTSYVVGTPASASMMIVDDETPVVTVYKIADASESGAQGTFRFVRTGQGLIS